MLSALRGWYNRRSVTSLNINMLASLDTSCRSQRKFRKAPWWCASRPAKYWACSATSACEAVSRHLGMIGVFRAWGPQRWAIGKMPAIFISHSSRDSKPADDIKVWLASLGYERVFLDFDKDTGIGAGDDWEKRLYAEIDRCHAVILVLTPNWLASKWCFAELTQARALGKVLLPVICAPLGEHKVLP